MMATLSLEPQNGYRKLMSRLLDPHSSGYYQEFTELCCIMHFDRGHVVGLLGFHVKEHW